MNGRLVVCRGPRGRPAATVRTHVPSTASLPCTTHPRQRKSATAASRFRMTDAACEVGAHAQSDALTASVCRSSTIRT